MKKLIYSIFTIAALAGTFVSCGGDDDNGNTPTPETKDGVINSQTDPDLDPAALEGNVTADVTLSNDQNWNLTGPLNVKDGATLTIEEGTTILAATGGTDVYLIVEQGGKLMANGTQAAPIRFTSAATDKKSGDWGGVLLLGRAPISGGGTSLTEVVQLPYGGDVENDNSGTMNYVVMEYTGARINGDKEFNGLTLYGVGSATKISNIVINSGDDDAIEFFGGTVSVTNLMAVNAKDDMFDWTQGWSGKANSNWYGIRTASYSQITEDPRGIEADGNLDGNSPGDSGQSNPTIDKVSIINAGTIQLSDMVKIRRGSSATITNLYLSFANAAASAGDVIDLTDSKGAADASTSITGTVNTDSGIDITDVVNEVGASINLTPGTTPSVDVASFAWAGINL